MKEELVSKFTALIPFLTAMQLEEIEALVSLVVGVVAGIISIIYTLRNLFKERK
ncbi:MAG: hypothetical protein QXI16_02660 [Sulfolobaceae archaeon]